MNTTITNVIYIDVRTENDYFGRLVIDYRPCFVELAGDDLAYKFLTKFQSNKIKISFSERKKASYIKFSLSPVESNGNDSVSSSSCNESSTFSLDFYRNWATSNLSALESRLLQLKTRPFGVVLTNGALDSLYILLAAYQDCNIYDPLVVGSVYLGMDVVEEFYVFPYDDLQSVNFCYGITGPNSCLALIRAFTQYDCLPCFPEDAEGSVNFNDLEEVLRIAASFQHSGSMLFKMSRYGSASCFYMQAVRYLSHVIEKYDSPFSMENDYINCAVTCMLSSANCKLKLQDYNEALNLCNEALEYRPKDSKIYFRRGQAYHGLSQYDLSLVDLKFAVSLSPNNESIKREIATVEAEMKVYLPRKTGPTLGGLP